MLEIDTEFEQGAAAERMVLPSRVRTDRTWLMAERLAAVLRRQGFIVRVHFLVRWLERARAFGVRLDPATFRRQFLQARHYRQTRPGYRNRIAVVAGMPVLYRMGGPRGRHVVLLGVLPRMPPVTRAPVPLLAPAREAEAALRFDSPEIRTVCEQARAYGYSVPAAFRPPLHPDRYRRRRDALNWLAGTARHWARRLGGLSAADINRLVTCLVALERVIRPQGLVDVTRLRNAADAELLRRGRFWPGQGPFSDPQAYNQLSAVITQERRRSGIRRKVKSAITPDVRQSLGGTVAAGMTTIEQLRGLRFIGRSPEAGGHADPTSSFAPSAKLPPHTQRHAEQDLADKFHAAAKGLSPSDWQGRTLSILVEAAPCWPCMNEVLPKLSKAYRGLTIEVKNLESSRLLRYRNGALLP